MAARVCLERLAWWASALVGPPSRSDPGRGRGCGPGRAKPPVLVFMEQAKPSEEPGI